MLKGIDLAKITKLTSHQVDHVTCIECCKYYIAPETASCGHTLCHACWRGRRSCPVCAASIERRTTKLNLPLQSLTEHVHALGEAFEKLFNIKLEEFSLDIQENEAQIENDPTKHVKDWLASSQNNFSVPPHNTESTQDTNPVEICTSKAQVHTNTRKSLTPKKVICAPLPQDDWDKIEPMPDPEDITDKNKENVVGPMDIEPFFVDDNEYSTNNPRRSSRKRDIRNDSNNKVQDMSTDKQSSKNSSNEVDKKSNKTKQDWSNVKRMRKEFSKLNKKNRNKLNVSIEMCKKTQNSVQKGTVVTPPAQSQQAMYVIDDNTPDVTKDKPVTKTVAESVHSTDEIGSSNRNNANKDDVTMDKVNENVSSAHVNVQEQTNVQNEAHSQKSNNSKNPEREPISNTYIKQKHVLNSTESETAKMSFIQKGSLINKSENNIQKTIVNKENESSSVTTDTDDIEISIKIGNTLTNIVIKKKKNDVQLKVNSDREIQTSLGPYVMPNKDGETSKANVQNIEINLGDNDLHVSEIKSQVVKQNTGQAVLALNKSVSTKKNTASADTATAQFEITESVEKELSKIMECEENVQENVSTQKSVTVMKDKTPQIEEVQDLPKTAEKLPEGMEDLNDIDIFNSGSVKEQNVQLLKSTHAPSEILMPTAKTNKSRTQKADKRNRDDEDDVPSNKKARIEAESSIIQVSLRETDIEPDSEPINYDDVMGQVFANIDADIEIINTQKTAKSNKNAKTQESQHAQIIKTQDMPKDSQVDVANFENQKYSENVFSILEKDDEHQEDAKSKQDRVCVSTQQHIANLLTPGMCRDLAADTHHMQVEEHMQAEEHKEMNTPHHQDDSDKDVVEETPQKNMSFSKLKKSDANKTASNKQSANETSATLQKPPLQSQKATSIINLSDTLADTKSKDVTIIDTVKKVLETPLTINKFVNHITHKSTPMARKSLNFEENDTDMERTLCPTISQVAKTTQEKEFMSKAFEQSQKSPVKRPLGMKNIQVRENRKYCLAGSCLSPVELSKVKLLCSQRDWAFVDKYTKNLTHLVVGVDDENRSQRSVKYMCALAASKWIVSYEWVERCLKTKTIVDEERYEALDGSGEPGPRRSRLASRPLFHGITFYCMPPFSVLDVDTLRSMLEAAGGRVVVEVREVRVTSGSQPALLLAEPENTQEDRFIYLALELGIVPVNYEWALNCLGSHTICSARELLLCPASLLPTATAKWPYELLAPEAD